APDFTLMDQDKKEVKLSDFKGKKKVVLVFYPLDWSPTCTNEHACLVNDMRKFEQLDAQVLGISVDSVWSHKAYAEKMGIHYPLLADFQPRGAASDKFGVYLADKGITGRAIAIVGKDGIVGWFKNYDIPVVPDLKEIAEGLGAVKSLPSSVPRFSLFLRRGFLGGHLRRGRIKWRVHESRGKRADVVDELPALL